MSTVIATIVSDPPGINLSFYYDQTTTDASTTNFGTGDNVQLTVTTFDDYTFAHWSGDVASGHEHDNPLTVSVASDPINITAHFVPPDA